MSKGNQAEGENQKRIFQEKAKSKAKEESNIERIDEVEWMKLLLLQRLRLKVEMDEHNATIIQFNTTLDFANKIEEISGLRPIYFIHTEGYPVIEVDSKRYGFIQPLANDEDGHDEEESFFDDEGLEEVTADEWFLISYQVISRFNMISDQLEAEMGENIHTENTVELFKERNGLRIIYTVDLKTGELGYEVVQKPEMGFSAPKTK